MHIWMKNWDVFVCLSLVLTIVLIVSIVALYSTAFAPEKRNDLHLMFASAKGWYTIADCIVASIFPTFDLFHPSLPRLLREREHKDRHNPIDFLQSMMVKKSTVSELDLDTFGNLSRAATRKSNIVMQTDLSIENDTSSSAESTTSTQIRPITLDPIVPPNQRTQDLT